MPQSDSERLIDKLLENIAVSIQEGGNGDKAFLIRENDIQTAVQAGLMAILEHIRDLAETPLIGVIFAIVNTEGQMKSTAIGEEETLLAMVESLGGRINGFE